MTEKKVLIEQLPQLLTLAETAELFNVSKMTVTRWIAQGKLRRIPLGGRAVRIDPESVKALLEGGKQ